MRRERHLVLLTLLLPAVVLFTPPPAKAREIPEARLPAEVDLWVNRANMEFRVYKNVAAIYEFGRDLNKPYFWPLEASNNKLVTRSWPMIGAPSWDSRDRPYQKSAWFGHGDVIPADRKVAHKIRGVEGVDFWSETKDSGRIVCTRVFNGGNDQNHAWVTTRNEWRTPDGDKIMDEVRKIQFINYETARLFVLDIDLHASVVPITFGDTHKGGLAVRVADSIAARRGKGRITNAEGRVGEKGCAGRISAWCDYSGPVEDSWVGVAIFAGPDNPVPSVWSSRAYGLMSANPFAHEKSGASTLKSKTERVHVDKGQHLKLRYGLFVHLGDAKQGQVEEYFEKFTKIPK